MRGVMKMDIKEYKLVYSPEKEKPKTNDKLTYIKTPVVSHKCGRGADEFEYFGRINTAFIDWPVFFSKYQISYCPFCGVKLPINIGKKETGTQKENE